MRNYQIIILLIVLLISACKKDDQNTPITPSDKIYVGSLVNPDNSELQNFYEKKYNIVEGDIIFENQNLINLTSLEHVKKIEGSLVLAGNNKLQNISALKNLTEIGKNLEISDSPISSLSGLDNLEKVENSISLSYLPIDNLVPLSKIKMINGNLVLNYLTELENLSGLDQLTEVKSEFTLFNLPISNFENLNSLTNIGGNFKILSVNNTVNLKGLDSLKNIGGDVNISNYYQNESLLKSLDGFNPDYVNGSLLISNQKNLENFCSLKNIFENDHLSGEFICADNKYNPTIEDILVGECAYQEPIALDGIYIIGGGTALTDLNQLSQMHIARNEVTQEDRTELKDKFLAVNAGSEGFNIVVVENGNIITMGPGNDFSEVTDLDPDEPTLGLWRGSIIESETPFTVPENGLYHIAYDSEIRIVTIARVVWGVIGAASPGGWAESTQLSESFTLSEVNYTINELPLVRGDYKLRYSNGWKVILDPEYDLGDGNSGIKVNANLGGSIENLIPGGSNLVNNDAGYYSLEIDWTLEDGFFARLYKTGDLGAYDYSETELGLIGDGLIVNGSQHNWEETLFLSLPNLTNDYIYTWNFENVEVSTQGSFKIREGQTWNDMAIGYPDVTMEGSAAYDFESNGDGNFVPLVNGTYDIKLIIDANTETYTLDVNEVGFSGTHMYVFGDGCSAGWDNTAALEMEEISDGIFTITTELTTADGYQGSIKFITELGQWAPMYGADNNSEPYVGNLVYRETESDPDPAPIPVEISGNYTITVDINNLTYTVGTNAPKLFVPGSYQNWTPQVAPFLIDENSNGIYTGEIEFTGYDIQFKFTSEPSWDGIIYGQGVEDGTISPNGGAANLMVPQEGTYLITVDLNNLTWQYELIE